MKRPGFVRYSFTLLLFVSLMSPFTVLAGGDHKKNFKQGMKYEAAEEWDKAAEFFALAVADNKKNPEYQLHLQRALFNASQMYMKRGRSAAEQGDFQGAYISFRKAYAFDPVNELAKSEMDRMIRLQEDQRNPGKTKAAPTSGVKLVQTSLTNGGQPQLPQKLEKLRNVLWPTGTDLQQLIKDLASDLDLNVLFDNESFRQPRKVSIELRQVSAARALDYIFLQENLFFQKVGPRTILVATVNRRPNFQQLVLRTFYLANAAPKDIKSIIQAAIPAQPGRSQTIVLEDAATNSITIRDTAENIALIGKLISSLDKDRAEVVMDVAIYEVSKTDLLKLGNQIGVNVGSGQGTSQLNNLGGVNSSAVPINGNWAAGIARTAALGLLVPSSVISAYQSKGNTRLLASTQIHAFNNEDSSARIGQRVPVRSATFAPVGSTNPNNSNNFVGDVINYEQVGLTLKFKPIVFPNQDVQVAMDITSKDRAASADPLTPVFTERSITGTARVQNNKTLLLASVAQGSESNGRQGLPFLGWLPIIGRLFATPTRDNSQVDIVIAVTPRVLRAPSILPEDEAERPTGSQVSPTNSSLEAMIVQDERDEQLAVARNLPNAANIQLPDRAADTPAYVPDNKSAVAQNGTAPQIGAAPNGDATATNLKPIDTSVKTLQINQTSDTFGAAASTSAPAAESVAATANVKLGEVPSAVKSGEKYRIPVLVDANSNFRSALVGLKFDAAKFVVGAITLGEVFGAQATGKTVAPFLNQNGKTYVTLALPEGISAMPKGVIAYIEVQALVDGPFQMEIDKDVLNFLTIDGKNFAIKVE